jgi:hypothetical protein
MEADQKGFIMKRAIVATGFGIAAILMAVTIPQVPMAQPGADFQSQGMREDLGHPRWGEPYAARHAHLPAPAYAFVPERAPVHHRTVTPHRRHY